MWESAEKGSGQIMVDLQHGWEEGNGKVRDWTAEEQSQQHRQIKERK